MAIDKIGDLNKIIEPKRTKSVQKKDGVTKSNDSIQFSSESLKAAEEAKYTQIVKETPDVRQERIEELKAQMKDGTYDKHLDDKILGMVADKLVNNLLK
jgi:negative regulator of flagellin synthesis FlgM